MFGNETTNTTTASLSTSETSFAPYDLDYARFSHSAEAMVVFYEWSTVLSIIGSLFCFTFNAFLLYCLLTTQEFKSLLFFPIGLQALIDLIGPGISNLVYVILSFKNFRSIYSGEDDDYPLDFELMLDYQILPGIFQLCFFASSNRFL